MSIQSRVFVLCVFLALTAPAIAADDVAVRVGKLALESLLVDTHIDVPCRLHESWPDVARSIPEGDFDHPRAVAGGFGVAFMSIYTPAAVEAEGGGTPLAHPNDRQRSGARDTRACEVLASKFPSAGRTTRRSRSGAACARHGERFPHRRQDRAPSRVPCPRRAVHHPCIGVSNHIADSSYDARRPWDGLSPFGVEVVREMNRLGMMIDVSHLSDAAVRDRSVPVR